MGSSYLASRPLNKLLQTLNAASSSTSPSFSSTPEVADEETSLPRPYRTKLAQLRSGYCSSLNDYRERVGWARSGLCPQCNQAPHTVPHIFSCPSRPVSLTPLDLWVRPRAVAEELLSFPPFDLPPLARPPPETPPPLPPRV